MRKLGLSAVFVALGTVLSVTTVFASNSTNVVTTGSSTTTVFAQGTKVTYGPDDIAQLGNHIYVAYQNGVGSKREAANTGNKSSTIMEYSPGEQRLTGLLDERTATHSTCIASQLPLDLWHQNFSDPTLADAILDRIVHTAHRLEIKGESMRKLRSPLISTQDSGN